MKTVQYFIKNVQINLINRFLGICYGKFSKLKSIIGVCKSSRCFFSSKIESLLQKYGYIFLVQSTGHR